MFQQALTNKTSSGSKVHQIKFSTKVFLSQGLGPRFWKKSYFPNLKRPRSLSSFSMKRFKKRSIKVNSLNWETSQLHFYLKSKKLWVLISKKYLTLKNWLKKNGLSRIMMILKLSFCQFKHSFRLKKRKRRKLYWGDITLFLLLRNRFIQLKIILLNLHQIYHESCP